MRIVGGEFRGRPLTVVQGVEIRPTTDRVREAIASLLLARDLVAGREIVDLFAGTGAMGFELLSRGASRVSFFDINVKALRGIRASAERFQCLKRCEFHRADLFTSRGRQALQSLVDDRAVSDVPGCKTLPPLVFADPPYRLAREIVPLLTDLGRILPDQSAVVVEHAKDAVDFAAPGVFSELGHTSHRSWRLDTRKQYGACSVALLTLCA